MILINNDGANILIKAALKGGAKKAAKIKVSDIPFDRTLRKLCESNTCGHFNTTWMCPPACGDIDELIAKAKTFQYGVVYQTVYSIEDSLDIEGMIAAGNIHKQLSYRLQDLSRTLDKDCLNLSGGACNLCKKCAYKENKPCRFPNKAMVSMECYGMNVSGIAKVASMNYINGQNTVTYFGIIMFNEGEA